MCIDEQSYQAQNNKAEIGVNSLKIAQVSGPLSNAQDESDLAKGK